MHAMEKLACWKWFCFQAACLERKKGTEPNIRLISSSWSVNFLHEGKKFFSLWLLYCLKYEYFWQAGSQKWLSQVGRRVGFQHVPTIGPMAAGLPSGNWFLPECFDGACQSGTFWMRMVLLGCWREPFDDIMVRTRRTRWISSHFLLIDHAIYDGFHGQIHPLLVRFDTSWTEIFSVSSDDEFLL